MKHASGEENRLRNLVVPLIIILGLELDVFFWFLLYRAASPLLRLTDSRVVATAPTFETLAKSNDRFIRYALNSPVQSYTSEVCERKYSCERRDPLVLTGHAWRMLALARDVSEGDNQARDLLWDSLTAWREQSDGFTERLSLHQLYEAYRLTGYDDFLYWFWERFQQQEAIVGSAYAIDAEALPESFFSATLARQFAQAAKILRTPKDLKQLVDMGFTDLTNTSAEDLDKKVQHLLEINEKLIALSEHPDSLNTADLLPGTKFGQMSCWTAWAQSARYSVTHSEDDLIPIRAYFWKLRVDLEKGDAPKFQSAQALLPCLHTLLELRQSDLSFLPLAKQLIHRYLIPAWDDPSPVKCRGSGGVFARLGGDGDALCEDNVKTLADNSWLRFLITKDLYDQAV
jgi:hypothetical protein